MAVLLVIGACHATGTVAKDAAVDNSKVCAARFGNGAISQWVSYDATGKLKYEPLSDQGDRIMDYSYAGYMGGGVALPAVPGTQTVMPSGGDDTAIIQAALDAVAKRPLAGGFRGAIVLASGIFHASAPLHIDASGVVLRGSGSATTEIDMTGAPHNFLAVGGSGTWKIGTAKATITDTYVPSGARSFTVDHAGTFQVGDTVLVRRPVTATWVHFMGMDQLVRDGMPQTWLSTSTLISADRVISSISGNRITLDVPLSDSYDMAEVSPPGVTVVDYSFPDRIEQVGLEGVRVVAPAVDPPPPIDQPLYTLLAVSAVSDGWVRDVVGLETENSVSIDGPSGGSRSTG